MRNWKPKNVIKLKWMKYFKFIRRHLKLNLTKLQKIVSLITAPPSGQLVYFFFKLHHQTWPEVSLILDFLKSKIYRFLPIRPIIVNSVA